MKKSRQKLLACFMAVAIILSGIISMNAMAADVNGSCGSQLTWVLDETTGVLTVSGTGEMRSWTAANPAPWYEYRTLIVAVSLPDGLENIGNYAFYNCAGIRQIIIPDSVSAIGDYAFSKCAVLESVGMPDNLETIGKYSFDGCYTLASIDIPAGLTSIGMSAFNLCNSISAVNVTNLSVWCGINFNKSMSANPLYNGASLYINGNLLSDFIAPEGVTAISAYLFCGYKNLNSVTLPAGVTSIGDYAFYQCSALKTCTAGEGLLSIGKSVFSDCSSMSEFMIPSSVETIGSSAFYGCGKMTEFTLPPAMKKIESNVFDNCSALQSIVIPEGVTTVNMRAFNSCYTLAYVSIPSTATSVSSSAFASCVSIREVANASSLPITAGSSTYGALSQNALRVYNPATESSGIFTYNDFEFLDTDDGLYLIRYIGTSPNAVFPESVSGNGKTFTSYEVIGPGFAYNDRVTSVTVTPAVTKINAQDAFSNCDNIVEIYNRSGRTLASTEKPTKTKNVYTPTEGQSILAYTDDAVFMNASDGVSMLFYCGTASDVTLPSSVTISGTEYTSYKIGEHAFYENTAVTSVTIPSSVKEIGHYAFQFCSNLASVNMAEGITSIGYDAFSKTAVSEIRFPTSAITLFDRVCKDCPNLTSVTLSENTKSLPGYAFQNCTLLTDINFPAKLTAINSSVFQNCKSLTDITLTNVSTIGTSAFKGCSALENITFSDSLSLLGTYAFQDCYSLETVDLPENIRTVSGYAFASCCNLTSIDLPDNATSFGASLFQGCRNLETVSIPAGVTSIGQYAFDACDQLEDVQLPQGITSLSNYTFRDCTSLTEINIPENVTTIGTDAFAGCTNLAQAETKDIETWCAITFKSAKSNPLNEGGILVINNEPISSITLPDEITSISNYAFYGAGIDELIVNDTSLLSTVGTSAFAGSDTLTVVCPASSVAATAAVESGANTDLEGGVPVTAIQLSLTELALNKDKYQTLTATVTPDDATNPAIRWISSDTSVASVTPEGKVTGLGAGTAIITATAVDGSGVSATCSVSVHEHSFGEWAPYYSGRHRRTCACGTAETAYCSYSDVITPPTCTERGFTTSTCTVCGYEKVGTYVEATGHTPKVLDAVPASCTSTGLTEGRICSVCNEVLTAQTVIDKLEHSFSEWTVRTNATCSAAGEEYRVCSACLTEEIREIAQLTHVTGDWVTQKTATCSEEGKESRFCQLCNTLLEERIIEKTPHAEQIWLVTSEASCSNEGSENLICPICSEIFETRAIAKLPHTQSVWLLDAAATCTEKGSKHIECTVCREVLKTEEIPATGHTSGKQWIVDIEPTTSHKGEKSHRCTICGERTDITAMPKLTSEIGEWVTVKAPTCRQEGEQVRVINVFGDTERRTIPCIAHVDEDEDYLCDRCRCKMENFNVVLYVMVMLRRFFEMLAEVFGS